MALLNSKADEEHNPGRETLRLFTVTAKLTEEESKAVTDFAQSQGLARGPWIREVILSALRSAPANTAALAEIVGVRLLLVNVLRPLLTGQKLTPGAFDKLLDEISTIKHQLASKLAAEKRR
jgi:hypothetical protein